MPGKYAKSAVKENIDNYIGELSKILKSKKEIKKYSNLSGLLYGLSAQLKYYYQPSGNGDLPVIDEGSKNDLLSYYNEMLTEAKRIARDDNTSAVGEQIRGVVNEMIPLLEQDMLALEMVILDKQTTLPEVIATGRTHIVDFGDQEIGIETGLTNKRLRIRIENGGVIEEGYFTETLAADTSRELKDLLSEMSHKYPEFDAIFKGIEEKHPSTVLSYDWNIHPFTLNKNKDPEDRIPVIMHVYNNDLFGRLVSEEEMDILCENPKFHEFADEFISRMQTIKQHQDVYFSKDSMGIKKGSNIDKRNIGAYRLGCLFGKPGLFAEAKPMTIIRNGKKISGTFMNKVEGVDLTKIKEGDPVTKYKNEAFDNPELYGDIAAAQAIGFIIGNIDMHHGNMLLRFDPADAENAKLRGFTFIDNDTSFVLNSLEKMGDNEFVLPRDMVAISEETYNKMKSITKPQMESMLLDCGLSGEEIDKAWDRKVRLQNKIEADMQHFDDKEVGVLEAGKIRVIKENEWQNYKLDDLGKVNNKSKFRAFSEGTELIKSCISTEVGKKNDINAKNQMREHLGIPIPPEAPPIEPPIGKAIGGGYSEIRELPRQDSVKIVIPSLSNIKHVGGMLSRRYLISFNEDGQSKEFFFTEATDSGSRTSAKLMFNRFIGEYPQFEDVINKMRDYYTADRFEDLNYVPVNADNYDFEEYGISKKRKEELLSDADFHKFADELFQASMVPGTAFGVGLTGGIEAAEGRRTDVRNVAVSELADALGVGHVIARSRHATVMSGGRLVEGVIMDRAEGIGTNDLHDYPPITRITEAQLGEAFNNPEGLKGIADLQIFDYISLSTDRHGDNLFLKFADLDTDHPKLVSPIGIDNDVALGTLVPSTEVKVGKLHPLTKMRYISESMARKLSSGEIDRIIEAKLSANGNNAAEIQAAKDRIKVVKDAIKDNKLKIVKDNEWGKGDYTFLKLSDEVRGHFGIVKDSFYNSIKSSVQEWQNMSDEERKPYSEPDLGFTKGIKVDEFSADIYSDHDFKKLEDDAEKEFLSSLKTGIENAEAKPVKTEKDMVAEIAAEAAALHERLSKANPTFSFTSRAFKDLEAAANDLAKTANKLGRKMVNPEDELSLKDGQKLSKLIQKVADLNAAYKAKKDKEVAEGKALTVRGAARRGIADDVTTGVGKWRDGYMATVTAQNVREKPIAMIHRRIARYQSYLPEYKGDSFKKAIARILYYKGITRMDVSTKKGQKIKQALHPKNVEAECSKLMQLDSFKKLMQLPEEKLRELASSKNADALMSEFIKEAAKEKRQQVKRERHNQNANNNIGPQAGANR